MGRAAYAIPYNMEKQQEFSESVPETKLYCISISLSEDR